jgi:GNAT superfamily N-acetyltransferase
MIRAFEERDTEAVDGLLRELWGHDAVMHETYRPMHRVWDMPGLLRQTLVAERDGGVIGVGTIFESTIHPGMYGVMAHVATAQQRQRVGSALMDALAEKADGRPWMVKATKRDEAGMAFLHQRGFRPLMSTLTGLLDPQREEVRAWMDTLPTSVDGVRIEACPAESVGEAAMVLAAVYTQFHQWNPPAPFTPEWARAIFCGEAMIPGSVLVMMRGEQMIGAATLLRNPSVPDANEGYLVHVGVIGNADDALTAALIRRAMEPASERGLKVRFEADETYQPHRALFEGAPAEEVDRDFGVWSNKTS